MSSFFKPTRIALAVAALALPLTAIANQSLNSAGYSATIGGVINEGSIHSSSFNPAGNNLLLHKGDKFRFGYLSNIGGYVEIGESDDLDKKIDDMVDIIEAFDDSTSSGQAFLQARYGVLTVAEYEAAITNEFNNEIIPDLEKGGQFRAGGQLQVPLTPFLFRSTHAKGTFSLNASASAQVKGAFLGSDFEVVSGKLTTNSGLDVKAAVIAHLALGYGTNLSEMFEFSKKHGQLEAGARLNFYNVEAGRKFVSLQAEANSNDDSSASDNLTEDFLDNTTTETNIGLDVGFLWHSNNYQAGITFYNLNEPSFDYPDLAKYLDKTDGTYDAVVGLESIGKTKMMESVTLTRHAVVEAAVYSDSRNWMLQGAYTLGTATNFVGDEFQNLHISTGYFPKTAWLPGVRAGYSKNMKGTELTKIHAGATFFGVMHLDVAVATDQSSFDGQEVPRYAAISLGFEEKF